jgi:glycine cleavage system pyridoxal-binding protein P
MPKHLSVKNAQMIQQHRYILNKLATSNLKTRKAILQNAPSTLFTVLGLIFKLVANNQLNLTDKHKSKIKKHKRVIRATSGLNHKSIKTKLVRQSGGSLQQILSTVLPILGTLVKTFI